MAEKQKEIEVETAPDPDEDNLDDLDDVLDEFQPKPSQSHPSAAPTSKSPPSTTQDASIPKAPSSSSAAPETEEDFSKQLQAGMANLLSELDDNPDMQKQFEAMMQELIAAGATTDNQESGAHLKEAAKAAPKAPTDTPKQQPDTSSSKPKSSSSASNAADPFGDTIRKTMARMQQSGDAATAASTNPASNPGTSEDDILAQMMKELQSSGDGEEDFSKMLMSMMTQLTNKEILYEPMKELHDKFPAWMAENEKKTAKEELERYKEQQRLVGEIVGRFERKGYSDENEGDRDFIVQRMQKMQEQGSPPPDLVGDMSAAQDALGDLDAGCPTQ